MFVGTMPRYEEEGGYEYENELDTPEQEEKKREKDIS
jgi:hypothetical protein